MDNAGVNAHKHPRIWWDGGDFICLDHEEIRPSFYRGTAHEDVMGYARGALLDPPVELFAHDIAAKCIEANEEFGDSQRRLAMAVGLAPGASADDVLHRVNQLQDQLRAATEEIARRNADPGRREVTVQVTLDEERLRSIVAEAVEAHFDEEKDDRTEAQKNCRNCDGQLCMDCRTRAIHDECRQDCPRCCVDEPIDEGPSAALMKSRNDHAQTKSVLQWMVSEVERSGLPKAGLEAAMFAAQEMLRR